MSCITAFSSINLFDTCKTETGNNKTTTKPSTKMKTATSKMMYDLSFELPNNYR